MTKINEILTSIILYSLISYLLALPNLEYSLIITVLASQINILLPKNYRHTLLLYVPIAGLMIFRPMQAIPVMVGYASSILIALLSKEGCKLIYPIKNTTFTGPKNYLENNTKQDHAATIFLITLVAITLLLSFNSTEIIEKLENTQYSLTQENNYRNNTPEAIQYININPAYSTNKNITTTKTENTTTTIITDYKQCK